MYCLHCRHSNPDRIRICEACGRFLPTDPGDIPWQLTGTAGVAEGMRVQLANRVAIGRDRESDVLILDAGISRRHARLMRSGDGYVVTDQGSSNGTFVNGRRIEGPVSLHPGDVLRLGRSELTIDIGTLPPQFRTNVPPQTHRNGDTAPEPTTLIRSRAAADANGVAVSGARGSRRWLYLLAAVATMVVLGVVAIAALFLLRSELFPAETPAAAPPNSGIITLLNATDEVVTVNVTPLDEGGTTSQKGLLGQQDGELAGIVPGSYAVSFESPAEALNGECVLEMADSDLYRFLIVPAGVTVTRDGTTADNAAENGINASPLCSAP